MKNTIPSRQVIQASQSNFFYSFLFLPRKKYEAILAVYSLCRSIDDVVDSNHSVTRAQTDLEAWREKVNRCFRGIPDGPMIPLAQAIEDYHLPREYFQELIRGVAMDLDHTRYKTFEDLHTYCYRVASVVGLICIEIFGYTQPGTRQHAIDQGIAFQLTNILRDLHPDAARGRIYLPQQDLYRFGYSEEELLSGRMGPAFVELMRFECARAREFYDKARAGLPREDRPGLVASEIMAAIYQRILEEIERNHYRVFDRKTTLTRRTRMGIAMKTWLANRFARWWG